MAELIYWHTAFKVLSVDMTRLRWHDINTDYNWTDNLYMGENITVFEKLG